MNIKIAAGFTLAAALSSGSASAICLTMPTCTGTSGTFNSNTNGNNNANTNNSASNSHSQSSSTSTLLNETSLNSLNKNETVVGIGLKVGNVGSTSGVKLGDVGSTSNSAGGSVNLADGAVTTGNQSLSLTTNYRQPRQTSSAFAPEASRRGSVGVPCYSQPDHVRLAVSVPVINFSLVNDKQETEIPGCFDRLKEMQADEALRNGEFGPEGRDVYLNKITDPNTVVGKTYQNALSAVANQQGTGMSGILNKYRNAAAPAVITHDRIIVVPSATPAQPAVIVPQQEMCPAGTQRVGQAPVYSQQLQQFICK